MAFIDSSNDLRRSWLLSFASRNEGEDIDVYSCMSFVQVVLLMFSRCAEMLLITARRAG